MRTLIENGWILTMDEQMHEYVQGHVVLENDLIAYVGEAKIHEHIDRIVDARGGIVLPGMVNTHAHVSMVPFRSLGDDCPDRLRRFLFPLELECMNESLTYLSAKYGVAEMLTSGITTFVDMYYYMDQVAMACEEMGIRALLGETIIQQKTCDCEDAWEGLALGEAFIKNWQDSRLITPIIAPHATNTNDANIFKRAMQIAQQYDTMLTAHVAEMDYEMAYFRDTYHMTPVEWLDSIHCLNDHFLAVHCIHMNELDLSLMKRRGASVAHCIASNMKAGKGIAPVYDMLQYQIPVGFGTDGPSSGNTLDLFTQMRMFAGAQKTKYHDRSLFPAKDIVRIATIGGAEAVHLDHAIGSLEVGKKADLIIVDTDALHMFPIHDPYSALVYSANASDVSDVFIDGDHVVKSRRTKIDTVSLRMELALEMKEFTEAAKRRSSLKFDS